MRYYPVTIVFLRHRLFEVSPSAVAKRADLSAIRYLDALSDETVRLQLLSHVLWMLDEIAQFEEFRSAKAGRWIGWVFANLEFMELITNKDSRDYARTDAERGFQ